MTAVLDRPTETRRRRARAARGAALGAAPVPARVAPAAALVLTLITVAVAATIFGAALGTNIPLPANAGFGIRQHAGQPAGQRPASGSDIAALRAHFGTVDVIENQIFATGLVTGAQLRAQNPDGAYGGPRWPWCEATTRTGPARST